MAEPSTQEDEQRDILVTLIAIYERKHFALDLPDPIAAIKFEVEQKGLIIKDLESMIGKIGRICEMCRIQHRLKDGVFVFKQIMY